MRDILELVVVLTAICIVAGISLAKVYDITKEPIAEQRRIARMKAVNAVLPAHDNDPDQNKIKIPWEKEKGKEETILIYKGLQNGQVSGLSFEMANMGFGGELKIMMGLNPDGTIQAIEITKMAETPGLGAKILEPKFKQQFQGKSLQNCRFKLKKDGGDLDQVTGATISPRAVVDAIGKGLHFYKQNKNIIIQ